MAGFGEIRRNRVRPVSTGIGTDTQEVSAGHLSGQPDGAAMNNNDYGDKNGLICFCDAWKRRLLSRAGAPK